MTEILISIQPKWCEKIMKLEKRWEMRKTKPKSMLPYRVFIYQTEGGGVIGEFVCDDIQIVDPTMFRADSTVKNWVLNETQLTEKEATEYADGKEVYMWRIRSLIDYPEPKPLSAFGLDRPPQSWCYVKGGDPDAGPVAQSAGSFGDMPVMREA